MSQTFIKFSNKTNLRYSIGILMFFMLSFNFCKAQTFVNLGSNSTSPNERDQLVPTTFSTGSKTQVLIRASELTSAGIASGNFILGVSYYITTDNTPATIVADCYADLSTVTDLPSTTFLAQPTFRGSISDAGTKNSTWRNITFSTPITWDGTSNLFIQVCRTSGGQNVSDVSGYKTTTFNSFITGYSHACSETVGYYFQSKRPQIGITYSTSLPVSWLSFTGRAIHGDVELNWATASELNNSHFEIQRSANAIDFSTIGSVTAGTNPSVVNNYQYLDLNPLSGTSYYRLKQVDIDGKYSFSSIIQINGTPLSEIKIYSDAEALHLLVPASVSGTSVVFIYDAAGRMLTKQQVLPGRNVISTAGLSGGNYFVQLVNGGKNIYSNQFVK